MAMSQEHLDETVETFAHLPSTVVLDDKRHLELRVLLQLVKLPGMEVGDEVAVLLEHEARQTLLCQNSIVSCTYILNNTIFKPYMYL